MSDTKINMENPYTRKTPKKAVKPKKVSWRVMLYVDPEWTSIRKIIKYLKAQAPSMSDIDHIVIGWSKTESAVIKELLTALPIPVYQIHPYKHMPKSEFLSYGKAAAIFKTNLIVIFSPTAGKQSARTREIQVLDQLAHRKEIELHTVYK